HPLARQGQAARALGAAYLSSLIGGLIGALGLTVSIPIARPLVLAFGSPELFMLTALGVSFAGTLLGKEPRKGIIAGLLGLLLGTIGPAPAAAELRFTFGQVYLWDGISLVVIALGTFGIAEVVTLLAQGGSIAKTVDLGAGWAEGIRDVIRHRWLVLRGALIGLWAGILPAIGATAGTWMAYGHVVATSKDRSRFGKGDIRGIIAPEAANNAVGAGDLVPTLLFSVPGGAAAALFMGALVRYGIYPGPRILTDHLSLIYVIIWSYAAANVVGAGLCFLLSPALARLTYIPFVRVAPPVILMMVLGAFQVTRHMGDLFGLLLLGLLGWAMKHTGWPRAPLLIGFVLAAPMERYFWLTTARYEFEWLLRPGVITIGLILIAPFVWAALQATRKRADARAAPAALGESATLADAAAVHEPARWRPGLGTIVSVGFVLLFAYALWESLGFLASARLLPLAVAIPGVVLGSVQIIQEVRGRSVPVGEDDDGASQNIQRTRQTRRIALIYLAGIALYYVLVYLIGFRLASALYMLGLLLVGARMRPLPAVLYTAATMVFIEWFGGLLGLRWPAGIV
ncbi:MAG: tripartite tricarboxylate transporter permease, partial [bacterium]